MKLLPKLLLSSCCFALLLATAQAEEVRLGDADLDRVTAGELQPQFRLFAPAGFEDPPLLGPGPLSAKPPPPTPPAPPPPPDPDPRDRPDRPAPRGGGGGLGNIGNVVQALQQLLGG